MNLPSTPPTIKGAIGAAGKEIANVGQNTARSYIGATKGLQNVGSQIRSNLKAGQSSNYNASTNINPIKGVATAFRAGFK